MINQHDRDYSVFNRIFKGLWQYILDHAKVDFNGQITVHFVIQDKEDFYKKIKSRVFGQWKAVDVGKLYETAVKTQLDYEAHTRLKNIWRYSYWELLKLRIYKIIGRYCMRRTILIEYPYIQEKRARQSKTKQIPD